MAEGVFRHQTNHTRPTAHPLIRDIDSCGTGAYHVGDNPDPRTLSVLSAHGINKSFYSHRARKFQSKDFEEFDYIFAMDEANLGYLKDARKRAIAKSGMSEQEAGQVMLFGAWGDKSGKGNEEVGDPYYGGQKGFEIAYEQVDRFSKNFVDFLEKR